MNSEKQPMSQNASEVLAQADFCSDNIDYAVIRLPPNAVVLAAGILAEVAEPFLALIVDKDEVTLVIPREAIDDFKFRLRDYRPAPRTYRLITIDIELDFDVIGLTALVSKALADTGIPILPLAAYSRDHVLVPADQIDIALQSLQRLKSVHQT